MCFISLDALEAIPVSFTRAVTPVIVASLRYKAKICPCPKLYCYHRLLLLGGGVTVISGQPLLPRVGHGVAILATHAGDLLALINIVTQIQIKTLDCNDEISVNVRCYGD